MSGLSLWLPIGITVFTWWFSTGLILLVVRAPRRAHSVLLSIFGVLTLIAIGGLIDSSGRQTNQSVYCGFLCTLIIWGWHEASFLMGKITGPRPLACPPDAKGFKRLYYATATLIYHEVALFLTLILIAALTWQAPNQIGLWTFATLFALRLSSKFNIFLGVPNLTDEFFPDHLAHLKSYLPKRPMNALMLASLCGGSAVLVWLLQLLTALPNGQHPATALIIIMTLTALGVLEHIFMITPLPDAALWRWAAPKRAGTIEPN